MASWCRVKVKFDRPPSADEIVRLQSRLIGLDYDFPPRLFDATDEAHWYRSPNLSAEQLASEMQTYGLKGTLWMSDCICSSERMDGEIPSMSGIEF